jgi:NAD(P)-dependent dehydrogenase (short-subunit alcohol dehydrogenase family)
MDPAAFDRVLEVNLHGVWHTVRATLPHVVERRGYLLLNASMYAFMNGAMAAPYAVAKAGVEQLGRALRTELRPHGASAGVVYFGFLETDLVRRTFASPVIDGLREALPGWFTRPVPVERGVDVIVHAVEHRSARAFAPRWVAAASALRGVLRPLDERLADDPHVHEAIRLSEARAWSRAGAGHP